MFVCENVRIVCTSLCEENKYNSIYVCAWKIINILYKTCVILECDTLINNTWYCFYKVVFECAFFMKNPHCNSKKVSEFI